MFNAFSIDQLLIVVVGSAITGASALLIRLGWTWLRTRGHWEQVVNELATGVQIGYFEERLGKAAFEYQLPEAEIIDHYFVNRLFSVQAVSDLRGRVGVFAVTTRSKQFAPRMGSGGGTPAISVRLGRDRFSEVVADAGSYTASHGARRVSYSETHYLGNPGRYLTYVLALNDGGYVPKMTFGTFLWTLQNRDASASAKEVALRRLREVCCVNTYGEIGLGFQYSGPFGTDYDAIRLLD